MAAAEFLWGSCYNTHHMTGQHLAGIIGALGLAALAGGCGSLPQESRQFPDVWPGTQPLSEQAPTVSVAPITMLEQSAPALPEAAVEPGQEGLPTAAVLSALFVKHLHVSGVNAVLEPPDAATARYSLDCRVPRLGYTTHEGYPEQWRYRAELSRALRDEQAQTEVWRRTLAQQYDDTVLLNLLTELPAVPYKHDRILYRECIVPLWDAMAQSVGAVVISRAALEAADAPGLGD